MAKMSDGTEIYLFSWKNNLYVLWNKKYWSSLIQPIKESNVQCTLVMKPSYTWQIEYFKHQQNDQWETSTPSCENIKSMYYFKCYNCTTLELLNITYSIERFWLIQAATTKSASFVMELNLYTTFNEQFIKWNGNMSFQTRLLAKLLENNLLCRPKRLMNCFSQIKITCDSVYLLLSLFLALVCLAFWTPIAHVMKETTQRVTWNRGKSIKFPPHPSHLVSNSPPQQQPLMSNSRPPGHVNESNARGMPGGWMLMSLFDRYISRF